MKMYITEEQLRELQMLTLEQKDEFISSIPDNDELFIVKENIFKKLAKTVKQLWVSL